MKLCPDRRRSSRQDDDFTKERLRLCTRLGAPGDLRGCRFPRYRSRQGYCICGSGPVRVQSQWRLYYLHDWFARTVLQSRSHYQRGGGDRSSTCKVSFFSYGGMTSGIAEQHCRDSGCNFTELPFLKLFFSTGVGEGGGGRGGG